MSSENSRGLSIAGALTNPENEDVPVQPRQPRNLQGLLRFAMEATRSEDAPSDSDMLPMNEERHRFLREALKHLTVDSTKEVQEAIKVLVNKEKMESIGIGDPLPDDVRAAFIKILDIIEDIDMANDFFALGGFGIFEPCFASDNEEVRSLSYMLLGQLCQNNPFCQSRALELGYFNTLLTLIYMEKGKTLAKCLYAVSCSSREYEPATAELLAQDGCGALVRFLHDEERTVRAKAAFLIRHLACQYDDAREKFIHYRLVRSIVSVMKNGREDATEPLLDGLLCLVRKEDPRLIEQCLDPAIDLQKVLQEHLQRPEYQDDRYLEEKEFCRQLLEVLFAGCPQQQETVVSEADR